MQSGGHAIMESPSLPLVETSLDVNRLHAFLMTSICVFNVVRPSHVQIDKQSMRKLIIRVIRRLSWATMFTTNFVHSCHL